MELESHSFFHALSDPTRLRILALLHGHEDLCVCELVRGLGEAQPKISRHLALLRDLGIVRARQEGVWMHYKIHPELPFWAKGVLELALPVFAATPQGQADRLALVGSSPVCSADSQLNEADAMDKVYNVLFLCTGNSARSIMAEVLLNHWGKGRFRAFSAGSHPRGEVHPLTLELLQRLGFATEGLRSKSWDEFALPDAPVMDLVFTVCDQARDETCPVWPGQPIVAHWGVPDPAKVEGTEIERTQAFRDAFRVLENRVKLLASLPINQLDKLRIQQEVEKIGKAMPTDT